MQMPAKTNDEKELIPRSFLQSGNDLPITKSVSFKHPTIQEVFDIDKDNLGLHSEDIYYSMVNVFLTDPYTYMVYLDDKGIDYEKSSPFEVFVLLYNDYMSNVKNTLDQYTKEQVNAIYKNNIFFKAFDFFLGIESFYVCKDKNGCDVIGYGDGQFLINSEVYDYVIEFVKKINGIQDEEHICPADDWAKQILIEDERERLKKQAKKRERGESQDKPSKRLGNLISAITWSCNGGITPFNRGHLHMYDLIDGINRTDKLLNYKNTMVGLYSGCIEKKKIDFKELHWSS